MRLLLRQTRDDFAERSDVLRQDVDRSLEVLVALQHEGKGLLHFLQSIGRGRRGEGLALVIHALPTSLVSSVDHHLRRRARLHVGLVRVLLAHVGALFPRKRAGDHRLSGVRTGLGVPKYQPAVAAGALSGRGFGRGTIVGVETRGHVAAFLRVSFARQDATPRQSPITRVRVSEKFLVEEWAI